MRLGKLEDCPMPAPIDLAGQRFGRLLAVSKLPNSVFAGSASWICQCECGTELLVRSAMLRRGLTRSCGCLRKDTTRKRMQTHGLSKTPTYQIWAGMMGRCFVNSHSAFERYGGRGITVCDRWLTFENFLNDMGERPDGLSLDRINNNGSYSPDNCRWTDVHTQLNNRRTSRFLTYQGRTQTHAEWERELGFGIGMIHNRLKLFDNDLEKVFDPRFHPGAPTKLYTYRDQTKTAPQWAKVLGIHRCTFNNRLKNFGPKDSRVFTPKTTRRHSLTYNGKTLSIPSWAKELDLPPTVLYQRFYRHGDNPERVLHVGRLRSKRDSVIDTVPLQMALPLHQHIDGVTWTVVLPVELPAELP